MFKFLAIDLITHKESSTVYFISKCIVYILYNPIIIIVSKITDLVNLELFSIDLELLLWQFQGTFFRCYRSILHQIEIVKKKEAS